MKQNKTSIVLVPEISLTPQMIDRFISRFGKDEIAVLHSKLSLGERYDEWNRIKEGKAKKVIVYRYKRKTGYHKKNGHRQQYTQVKIEKINA